MSLQYIIGRAGSGKTRHCLTQLVQKKEGSGTLSILLVPEQFSSQAEFDLVSAIKSHSILDLQVLSFGRLAHRLMAKSDLKRRTPLGETGNGMILQKILLEQGESLTYFSRSKDKQGFLQKLAESMQEMTQYCITPAQTQSLQGAPLPTSIRHKLLDLETIRAGYDTFLKTEFLSSDDLLDMLGAQLSGLSSLPEAEIWVDGFYGFTPQEYRILRELFRLVKTVHITLTMDVHSASVPFLSESAPFYEPHTTLQKLTELAKEVGVSILPPLFLEENKHTTKEGLVLLEQHFFHYGKTHTSHEGLHILAAENRYAEIERTAEEILRLVREEGYRFREIAVVTGALSIYEKSLRALFQEYGIPCFLDTKRTILAHPLVALVQSALELLVYQFQYTGVMHYLRTGLAGLSRTETDLLENYILAYGIHGYRWHKPWEYGKKKETEEDLAQKNALRIQVLTPLLPLHAIDRKKKLPVRHFVHLVSDLLEALSIPEQLDALYQGAFDSGDYEAARVHEQVWKLFCELLETMVRILGDTEVTMAEFAKLLDAGLTQSDIGLIPPGVDAVLAGDMQRTRLPAIRALFVLGANEGILPSPMQTSGVFTEDEKLLLAAQNVALAPSGRRRTLQEAYQVYTCFCKPSEGLYLSYACNELDGSPLRPSSYLQRIQKAFPTLQETPGTIAFSSPKAAFHHLGPALRDMAKGKEPDNILKELFAFFRSQPDWHGRVNLLLDGLLQEDRKDAISPSLMKQLYKKGLRMSVSRLERFAACPFAYFAEYGLKAEKRQLYQLHTPDLGVLFHEVLEVFSNELEQEKRDWRTLTQTEAEERVAAAVDLAAPKLGHEILLDTSANRYLIRRLKRIAKRAVWTLVSHIQAGKFYPAGYEVGFGLQDALPPIALTLADGSQIFLNGKIDRIDLLDHENQHYVKIIDYKSGSKRFRLQEIYYGLQLQLLIYLSAYLQQATEEDVAFLPAGIFYFRLHDPSIHVTQEMSAEEIAVALRQELRLSGLALDAAAVICGMDERFASEDTDTLAPGVSDILPVAVKKDGSFRKSGTSVATLQQYTLLMNFAQTKAREIGERILQGEIAPKPYRSQNHTPCQYCSYQSICRFDPMQSRTGYRELPNLSDEAFWEALEKET